MKLIKYDSLANTLAELISQRQATENATDQTLNALTDALSTSGVDADYISYTVGQEPDSSGASSGTIGAYFKEDGLFQKLEWDGSEWVEIGESIVTRKYASLSPRRVDSFNEIRSASKTPVILHARKNLLYLYDENSRLPDDGAGVIRPDDVADFEPGRYVLSKEG